MLKIYTATQYLTEKNRGSVFPLLFDIWYLKNKNIEEFYSIVNTIKNADIVIVPLDITYFYKNHATKWLFDFIDNANQLQKKVWVYSSGDIGITLHKNVYTFRLGGFNSKLDKKTYILPGYTEDPYVFLNSDFEPVEKLIKPSIGFVGNAYGGIIKYVKEIIIYLKLNFKRFTKKEYVDYQHFYASSIKRFRYLKQLEKSKYTDTNFIFRKKYRAGVKNETQKQQTTFEFYRNIQLNPYTFCLRGGGNFSIRLYETLAMGRIPLLFDTDVRLPLASIIDWKKHCILVNEYNWEEKLLQFHNTISPKEFKTIQENNRKLWLNYLQRDSFFIYLHSIFKNEF